MLDDKYAAICGNANDQLLYDIAFALARFDDTLTNHHQLVYNISKSLLAINHLYADTPVDDNQFIYNIRYMYVHQKKKKNVQFL